MLSISERSDALPEGVPLTGRWLDHWRYFLRDDRAISNRVSCASVRCRGILDPDALRSSIQNVVRRHEVLRSRVVALEGMPRMYADQPGEFDLDVVNLFHVPSEAIETEIRGHAIGLMKEPIDLSIGPVFAAKLLSFSAEDHVLICAIDHSVSDGTSITILFREVWTCYRHAVQGQPFKLPPAAPSYQNYLAWEHRMSEGLRNEVPAYWKAHLAGVPGLQLPYGSTGQVAPDAQCELVTYSFGTAITQELRQVAKRSKMLFPQVFCALYAAVVLRLCKQNEAWMHFASSGRYHPAFQRTIGCLYCHLPLRLKLDAQDSFLTFLARLSADLSSALAHYPFGRYDIFSGIAPSDFVFNWIRVWGWEQQSPVGDWAIDGKLQIGDLEIHNALLAVPEPFFPLFLERRYEVIVRICHNSEFVPRCAVEGLTRNLKLFAEQLARDPEAPVPEYE